MGIKISLTVLNKNQKPENIRRAISALRDGSFTKIICGAANTNEKHVERLALVYSLSGADVIDISPFEAVYYAAESGIKKACEIYNSNPKNFPKFKKSVIMASINAGDDLHFRKAEINYNKCNNCLKCLNSCPARALTTNCHPERSEGSVHLTIKNINSSSDRFFATLRSAQNDKVLKFSSENCYGCGRCESACSQNAINFINLSEFNYKILDKCEAIEIHTGNCSIQELDNFLKLYQQFFDKTELLSFSVESKRFNNSELQDYINAIINIIPEKIIIQIDGLPMGATDDVNSSLQAIKAGEILLKNNTNAYIQISGGTNNFTKNLIKQHELKFSGIAYGTFARKIILSYLEEIDDIKFNEQLLRIINITTCLVGD